MTLSVFDLYGLQVGLKNVRRSAALNDNETFIKVGRITSHIMSCMHTHTHIHTYIQALADIVFTHIQGNQPCSRQLGLRCPMCVNPVCGKMREFFVSQ